MANQFRWAATAFLTAACSLPLTAQEQPSQPAVKVRAAVALSAGTCVLVPSDGVVSFRWNPGFTPADAVRGLRSVSLTFAVPGAEDQARRGHAGLVLKADARQAGGVFVADPDGIYTISLPVDLRFADAGDYRLVSADVRPALSSEAGDAVPEMTNRPESSFYCVTVAESARPMRGSRSAEQ